MIRIKHILLATAVVSSLGLFAQHNEEVTIEGTYRPRVNQVDKILMKPETPEQSFTLPEAKAKVNDIEHRFHLEMDKLSPLNYKSGKGSGEEIAKNFLMAGFGSRISPMFLYKHNSNLTKNLGLSVGIKHFSSWLGIKDYAPSSFMNNAFDLGLTSSKFSNLQLGGKVYYKNDMVHYYGVKMVDLPVFMSADQAAPRQTYNTIGASFDLASTNTRNGEFAHGLELDYHYLFDQVYAGKEHFASIDYNLGYADNWWGGRGFPQKVGVALGASFDKSYAGLISDERLIFKVNPYFEMKDAFYRLHLGVRMDGVLLKPSDKLLTVHPDLKASLLVLDSKLEFYAGLNGGRKLYTYSDLVEENPFVRSQANMEVTTVKLGFEGGLRTNLMKTMDVHVGVRYRNTNNDLFYRQKINAETIGSPYNSFDVVYDETRQVSVLGNIRWLALDKMTVDAGVAYNKYNPSKEEHAWYRPAAEGNLKLDYQFNDVLSMNASFLYQGGRWAQSVKLPDVYDLGFGVDYKLQDQFTVFAKADNLLNRKYQLYLDYPVTGIEFFAGLKMAF